MQMFTPEEVKLLMSIQYELPLSETPYVDLAEKTGLPLEFVLGKTEEFMRQGVIKRVGANLNYKAFKSTSKAALVGAAVEESRIEEVAKIINATNPKHNFLRLHEKYSIWFTIKAKDDETLLKNIEELMKKCGVTEYVVLPTKRVYKMDVKYDLIRGVSWTEKGIEPEKVPTVEELGLNAEMLRKLETSLPVAERPFKEFTKYGYSEAEIVDLIDELIKKGVVRDFSGVLKERKIGFKENGMTVIKTDDPESLAMKLLKDVPQITHLVKRIVPKEWEYPIYFMVHAIDKKPIEEIRRKLLDYPEVEDAKTLYSKMDLKTLGI